MIWTIANSTTEKTLAAWGLSGVRRKLVSQGLDELTFRAAGQAIDAAPLFAYGSTVTLYRNRTQNPDGSFSGGTPWFTGLVTQTPSTGAPDSEDMDYVIAGPWWYLEHLVFQQPLRLITRFNVVDGVATPVFNTTQTSTHLFLNVAPVGYPSPNPSPNAGMIHTGQQIIEALSWALKPFVDAGSPLPFQIGTIAPAVFVPHDEVRDITCAEVIHKELRWTPDAVTWFDYTTMPPTFNCARRADLPAAINLDISKT
jgi:hypothetical protein